MGRFLWISAKVFSGKNGTFLSLSEFRHKSVAVKVERPHSLTHSIDIYRLLINLGPLAQFMHTIKHTKVVAEFFFILCISFFVPSDKTCFEDPLPAHHMTLNLNPPISCFEEINDGASLWTCLHSTDEVFTEETYYVCCMCHCQLSNRGILVCEVCVQVFTPGETSHVDADKLLDWTQGRRARPDLNQNLWRLSEIIL